MGLRVAVSYIIREIIKDRRDLVEKILKSEGINSWKEMI